uniref:Uncharacterized protein n=1 Tax=uncultured bacterium A1Q1_fos_660 TaxID=1256588 RepID=L7VXS4_9BACT|nr:hypothetical protein [uncultured bacterium A1Q1_fos_660]
MPLVVFKTTMVSISLAIKDPLAISLIVFKTPQVEISCY